MQSAKNNVSVDALSAAVAGALNARRFHVFVKNQPVGEVTATVFYDVKDGEARTTIRIHTRDAERLKINRVDVRFMRGVETAPAHWPSRWRYAYCHSDRGSALSPSLPSGVVSLLSEIAEAIAAEYEIRPIWQKDARIYDAALKVRAARDEREKAEVEAELAFHRMETAVEALRALGIENTDTSHIERLIATNPD